MPFTVSTLVPEVIIPAKFYVDSLTDVWEEAPPKVTFHILIWTTLTTVLHYRADSDVDENISIMDRPISIKICPLHKAMQFDLSAIDELFE